MWRVARTCWICAVVAAQAAVPAAAQGQAQPPAQQAEPARQSAQQEPVAALPDFTALVKRYGGAVVNVTVVAMRDETTGFGSGLSPDDPFYDFFRRFGIPVPPGGEQPVRGQGSGFIISPDGYLLTNAHVVAQAEEVTVTLPDRREYQAKIVGVDPRTDVAVLKIEERNLPTVKFGDPSRLMPGEWAMAIGSPFGFANSVTVGVISATSRALAPEQSIVPFIQTDVAVNPGNSGGPLFNLRGEVVGINSVIYSRTGGYQGVSFAIPIDVALDVARQIIDTGRVVRGRIGVAIQNVTAQLAQSFGLDRPRGALVSSVEPDGPAAQAGLKPGDIILGVNGRAIETSSELPSLIASLKPGTRAQLDIWRNGRAQRIDVNVGLLEEPARTASESAQQPGAGHTPRLGLAVRPLTEAERQQAGIQSGLLVTAVTGPAALAGIQPGDVVLAVNQKPVSSVEELRKLTDQAGESVALLVQRGDAQIYVPIRLSREPAPAR